MDGVIAEILIFDKELSAAEKKVMHYYLSKKWGLESIIDSDGDGLSDGVEMGLSEVVSLDTDQSVFVADVDPTTTTSVNDADTDDDGLLDGVEDSNGDGAVDALESNPLESDTDGDGLQD